MGVKGAGLKSNGLHKTFLNGSQEDVNSQSAKTRTGGGVTHPSLRSDGLHPSLPDNPAEIGTPIRGGKTNYINGPKRG